MVMAVVDPLSSQPNSIAVDILRVTALQRCAGIHESRPDPAFNRTPRPRHFVPADGSPIGSSH
jgi:hypothetical protein